MHAVSFLSAEVHGQDPNMLTSDLSLGVENFCFVCHYFLSSCFPFTFSNDCLQFCCVSVRFCCSILFNLFSLFFIFVEGGFVICYVAPQPDCQYFLFWGCLKEKPFFGYATLWAPKSSKLFHGYFLDVPD